MSDSAMVDPGSVLSPDEVAAARAIVDKAPRLSPAQLDLVASAFRPYVRRALAARQQVA